MAERDLKATDPAAYQTTKADMEEDVGIGTTPQELAWAVARGGAVGQEAAKPSHP